jgi:hypothetical protein
LRFADDRELRPAATRGWSDAHDPPHAEHGKKARTKLTRYGRMMARRKPKKGRPGSKGYREARRLRAKAQRRTLTRVDSSFIT